MTKSGKLKWTGKLTGRGYNIKAYVDTFCAGEHEVKRFLAIPRRRGER
jgi:hypothetical protein